MTGSVIKGGSSMVGVSTVNSNIRSSGTRAMQVSDVDQVVPMAAHVGTKNQSSADHNYQDLMKMRKLRESFEYLTGISNLQNDLINRGKAPHGFQLLDAKDSARKEKESHRGGRGTILGTND